MENILQKSIIIYEKYSVKKYILCKRSCKNRTSSTEKKFCTKQTPSVEKILWK